MIRTVFFSDLDSPYGIPHFVELLQTAGCQVVAVVLGESATSETGGVMRVLDRWGLAIACDLLKVAADHGVQVLHPASLASAEFLEALKRLAPELLISAGFRRILPSEVLDVPSRAAVNLHPSRLPRVRGRNPWFWTVATGETDTAATAHHMIPRVDAGDIILQALVPVDARDTASSLLHKTTVESLRLIAPLVEMATHGTLPRVPQDLSVGSVYREPTDRDRTLDWSRPAPEVDRRVRASLETPGAITTYRDRVVRVLDAEIGTDPALRAMEVTCGTVLKTTPRGVAVKAGDGHVVLHRLGLDGQSWPASVVVGLPGGNGARDRFC